MLVHGKVRAILRIRRNLVVRYKHKVLEFSANPKDENRRKPVQISQTVRISRTKLLIKKRSQKIKLFLDPLTLSFQNLKF